MHERLLKFAATFPRVHEGNKIITKLLTKLTLMEQMRDTRNQPKVGDECLWEYGNSKFNSFEASLMDSDLATGWTAIDAHRVSPTWGWGAVRDGKHEHGGYISVAGSR
ncbi:hypothetical protein B0H11DRAFT_1926522 [Mycena galericulata]|nr:hypothetical protein B0H11DRAFT_1926522 [Mycena galericulata]